jgi:hypothetical protein
VARLGCGRLCAVGRREVEAVATISIPEWALVVVAVYAGLMAIIAVGRIRWPEGPVCAHCGAMDKITRFEGRKHRAGLSSCAP